MVYSLMEANKIGVIFNLDKHDQSGSHWVAMFIDLENKFFFYFDSFILRKILQR